MSRTPLRDAFFCATHPFQCIADALPPWAYWALGIFAALFVIGVLWRLKDFLALIHRIAGWPGAAAIVGAVAVLFAVFWPKRSKPAPEPTDLDGPDAEPPIRTKRTIRPKRTTTTPPAKTLEERVRGE